MLGSIAMVSGELLGDGAVNFTVNQLLEIGALPGGPSTAGSVIAEHLNDAGINTAVWSQAMATTRSRVINQSRA